MSKDEFPIFAHTGDVKITIRGAIAADGVEAISKTYLLHQDTLARCSGFFAASTSSQWCKAQSDPASVNELARDVGDDRDRGGRGSSDGDKDGGGSVRPKRQWRFELDHGTVYLDEPILVPTDPLPAQQEGSGQAGDSQSSSPSLSGPGSGDPAASHTILSSLQPVGGPPATLNGSQRVFDVEPDMRDILLGADKALLRNYDNLFRIFYNCRPMLDNADVFFAYIECKFVLMLADQYDALAVVRPCVEHHLLQFQSKLWRKIARCSQGFLELGYLARIKVIFKEALIHTVGIWHLCIPEKPDLDLPDFVLDIAEDKVYQLQEKVSRVEGQLFRLSLTTEQGEPVRPANDYLGWLVVSLFRQWLADKTKPRIWPACNNNESESDERESDESESDERESDKSHHSDEKNVMIPPIDIYNVYGKLGSDSPSAFLDHNDCEAFLALHPQLHTAENLVRFERRMGDLKAMARDLVRPLLHNSLELDVTSPDISKETFDKPFYFTCTTVEDDEILWPLDP
ncbi:hypothetical protein E4U60_001636 [Claviceps pazoutovae]|uniref:Uncharacterized protein n=1 Tax=Claviceps pazoutovae TaxID=1649127 RepID=A0A9P7MJT5_9HYPO|nr:hypothetical protein E4U60_001636 [Claviceps pazoutovae]